MKNTGIPLVILSTAFVVSVANAEPAVQRYEVIYHQHEVRDLVKVQTGQLFLEMDYQLDRDIMRQSVDALSEMSEDYGLQPYAIANALEQHPEQFSAMQRPTYSSDDLVNQ